MDWSWLESQDARLYVDFPTSLAIGLLIGLERERNPSAKAGLPAQQSRNTLSANGASNARRET